MDPAKRSRENFCLAVDGWTEIEEDKLVPQPYTKLVSQKILFKKERDT